MIFLNTNSFIINIKQVTETIGTSGSLFNKTPAYEYTLVDPCKKCGEISIQPLALTLDESISLAFDLSVIELRARRVYFVGGFVRTARG